MKFRLSVKKTVIALLALAMGTAPMANAYITAMAVSPGYVNSGPGVGLGTGAADNQGTEEAGGASIDAYAYQSTGGTAQGAMTISTDIPAGCVDSCSMEVSDPVVADEPMYTYDILVEDITSLQRRYPGRFTARVIGSSADSRSIYELVLGDEKAATHILIDASIHGREYITSNLCMKQLEYLLCFYDKGCFDGKPLRQWFSEVCLHFIPMVDPDGVSISQFGLDGLKSEELKETVRNAYVTDAAAGYTGLDLPTYLQRWKANARGVNLNQNFNAMFGVDTVNAGGPSFSYYPGPYAASEPETRALTSLYDSRVWRAVVNYHAQGQVIYWDIQNNKMREHSRDLSNNLMMLTGYRKAVAGGGGGFKEYVQLCGRPAASVTIEVGLGTCPLPSDQLPAIWAQNKFVPLYTMKWAYDKFVVKGDR